MKIAEKMFQMMSGEGCRQVTFYLDPKINMKAILVVDSLPRGNCSNVSGGTRFAHKDADFALNDALKLSKSMTRKSKVLGVKEGGAKAVVIADQVKDRLLLESVGKFIETQKGFFKTAIDMGFDLEDAKIISTKTKFIDSLSHLEKGLGSTGENTAEGMVNGLEVVCSRLLNKKLFDCSFSIQGLGAVGGALAKKLLKKGCKVIGADVNTSLCSDFEKLGVEIVQPENIFEQKVDIFSPCAFGGVLNEENISNLNCKIVAGGANNILLEERAGEKLLLEKGMVFVPDFVINAAGFLQALVERKGGSVEDARAESKIVGQRLNEIIDYSEKNKLTLLESSLELFGEE
jgi:leucine dehydrogenase